MGTLLLHVKKTVIIIVGAILNAVAMNFFLIPANVYASGVIGVAQLLSSIFNEAISTGILLFLLNVPIIILGFMKIGKSFTLYSFANVFLTTFFMEWLPILELSDDLLLNAVFGGVISALGIGLTLNWGASTGGMDIIAMVLSKMKDKPVGKYLFLLNGFIIVTAGLLYGWEKALYTLVTLYVTTRVIDTIHTRHEKLTAMIITKKAEEMKKAIHGKLVRGITSLPARGGYTNDHKEVLMIVISRYELFALERIIKEVDPNAFTNIVETAGIVGFFRRE